MKMAAPVMDAEVAAALASLPEMLLPVDAQTLAAIRAGGLGWAGFPLSDQVERSDHVIPGPPGAPDVILRTHVPTGLSGPAPCLYSIHGGGYIIGDRSIDDARFDLWCPKFEFIGVSVEYRLAPETPYPGPLDDCYAGLAWVHAHAGELGIDPARIGLIGASAGGGLAAALALLARDRGELPVAFQMLAYPMLDDRQITPSSSWEVPICPPACIEFGWRCYLGDLYGHDDVPGTAAPARAADLAGLPPTLVYVGTLDGFCDEDVLFATRLYQAGVSTELHVYAGAPHGFDGYAMGADVARRCLRETEEWLARALAGRLSGGRDSSPTPA
jgi:acetyl esterase/lipase